MISQATIAAMLGSLIFSLLLFVGLIIFYKRETGIYIKPLIIGSIGFIVITQVLEKILHVIVFSNFPNYVDNPWFLGVYGGLAAGVFEEIGRFLLIIWFLKKYRDYRSGISFGVGWGGIEAVVVMLLVVLPNLIFALMINAGTFETVLKGHIPTEQLAMIEETLYSQGVAFYVLSCLERVFAAIIQIALSLLVFVAVVKRKFLYVIYAILIHAVIDFPFAWYQTGQLSLWIAEIYLAFIAVLASVYIYKVKRILTP